MTPNQEAVAGAIAVLLSTTPEEHLGRLLKVCLAAKVEGDVTAKSKELFGRTEELAYWLHEVIAEDEKYTSEEWLALGDMELNDVETFVAKLLPDIEALSL